MSAASTRPAPPSERMIAHALRLIATAAVAPDDEAQAARQQLRLWVARSERHAMAHAEALRRWKMLDQIGTGLRDQFAEPAPRRPVQPGLMFAATLAQPGRRKFLAMAAAGLLGGAAILAWQHSLREFSRRYRTRIAESFAVELPDGSQLYLDADSEILAEMYAGKREVALQRGRVRFEVTPDVQRPFIVPLRIGEVEVVGTIFTVTDRGESVQVGVSQGHVRWRPDGYWPWGDGGTVDLYAGDRLSVRTGQAPAVDRRVVIPGGREDSWRDGWLVFDNMPLLEALPVLNAYLVRPLKSLDPRVGQLRLTARLRADDPKALLAALPLILPIRVEPDAERNALLLRLR
ncbi:FecR domain-containing protein [Pseudomonas sp. S 311-6]|uniref:FecR family protein n=1 Tax=Kerstersia gyiorum TaxID=206506 RepID=UPI0020981EAE|nr:FecR domain-containing protein [Pseudomonas sp. S 311-6]